MWEKTHRKAANEDNELDESKGTGKPLSNFEDLKVYKSTSEAVVSEFNQQPAKAIDHLISSQLVEKNPASVAQFLRQVLIYAWKFLNWIWIRPKKLEKLLRQQGFNGNSYTLLYGDFTEIKATAKESKSNPISFSDNVMARASPIYYKAVQKYGEKCFVWLGPKPAVVISDPEMIREIMSKNYVFQKPNRLFTRVVAKGLVSLETDEWAKHRKLINPAFHIDKLKHMIPSFYLSCGDMLNEWDKIVASNNGSCCEVDVWPYLQTMTSDVISRTAFGSSYEEGRKIFQLQAEQARRLMEATTSLDIPGYRFLPTKFNRRTKEAAKEIESTLLGIINKRIKAMEEASTIDQDLLGLLLDSNMNEIKQHGHGSGMSMKEVIEECKIFYFAGQETTAALLVWTMILLSKHQDWQARARDEVLQVFKKGKPDYQDLNHLKILNMILYEVLRLYPPSVVIPRTVVKEMAVGEVILPEGVQLMMHITQLHRHCKFWGEDANEFKPERFEEGVSKATQGRLAYFPFGWGPRICIGQNFAMVEVKMAMAMILQHYSFELSPSYSHAPHTVITLQPQHGAYLILKKL